MKAAIAACGWADYTPELTDDEIRRWPDCLSRYGRIAFTRFPPTLD